MRETEARSGTALRRFHQIASSHAVGMTASA